MLLMSRHAALAAEEYRAEILAELEPYLLTKKQRDDGLRLAPPRAGVEQGIENAEAAAPEGEAPSAPAEAA